MADQDQTAEPSTNTMNVPSEGETHNEEYDEESMSKKKDEDKPKKHKIEFEATLPRGEAVSYFESIINALRSGRLEFKQDDKTLILVPPDRLNLEVKAQSKGDKGRVVFEIEWSDEHHALEITS